MEYKNLTHQEPCCSNRYKIKFTDQSLEDINEICEYISKKLEADKAAKELRKKIIKSVEGLSRSPEMYAKIFKTDRAKREYRKIPVNNYVLLYTVDEKEKIVYIAHMYYGGRNYLDGLM